MELTATKETWEERYQMLTQIPKEDLSDTLIDVVWDTLSALQPVVETYQNKRMSYVQKYALRTMASRKRCSRSRRTCRRREM